MSVLAIIDHGQGQIKKSTGELLAYSAALANALGTEVSALILGTVEDNLSDLGKYGVSSIFQDINAGFNTADNQALTAAIAQFVTEKNIDTIVFPDGTLSNSVAPRLSAKLKAGFVSNAIGLPKLENGFSVKKAVYSGKAFAWYKINTAVKVISISSNSFEVKTSDATANVEAVSLNLEASKVTIQSVDIVKGEIPLSEASIVVSGGRGLKGPENWKIVEDLAHSLHAGLACSRPVSDSGWRPHHEHVGQTGKQIAPNLYIAAGISGAIQHLGGVNRSKVIVVINNDPEAPFFKAADYGIVGDVFEILPRLTAAVNNLN
ncbi:electron transfer flavoprotein subunit alpha/FixB family protein [Rhizosphaericola mali]|uniref:Electron transfer flavoprotein subunit alpha/FixB family protein n=1 Tax=Rhizosphaericola mali TaxID=2545455 RepID=A0A5P2G3L1_9BACT|nr:electron transfer flavoprotein subunit alpha/FixB family protein [Rhizosphaericola mali]QES90414.1 electron transfer flavoprotein subunit alpha/FixB family protein [Rhizosphaericola mali]